MNFNVLAKKSAFFVALLSSFSSPLLYSMEQDPHGNKRSFDEISKAQTNINKKANKRAKIEAEKEQESKQPNVVKITTAYEKTFEIPRHIAELSPTLAEFIKQILEEDPHAKDLRITFFDIPFITNEVFEQVFKVLEGIYTTQGDHLDIAQTIRGIISSFNLEDNEYGKFLEVIRYFDLDSFLNANIYYFVATNGTTFEIESEKIEFIPYFRNAFSAGLLESITKELHTNLSEVDLTLFVGLIDTFYPHAHALKQQFAILREYNQEPDQNVLMQIKKDTTRLLCNYVNATIHEHNDVTNLLETFHVWGCEVFEKALLLYLAEQDEDTLKSLEQGLPIYYYKNFFTKDIIQEKNFSCLFNWFMNYINQCVVHLHDESKKSSEKEKEKEVDPTEVFNTFEKLSIEDIADILTIFKNFMQDDSVLVKKAIQNAAVTLNEFIAMHQKVVEQFKDVPRVLVLFEEIMQMIVLSSLTRNEDTVTIKGIVSADETLQTIGTLSRNRCAMLSFAKYNNSDKKTRVIIIDVNTKKIETIIQLKQDIKKAFILNDHTLIIESNTGILTLDLDADRLALKNIRQADKSYLLGAGNNIYIMHSRFEKTLTVINQTTRGITTIKESPWCTHAVVFPNNSIVIASDLGELYSIDMQKKSLISLHKKYGVDLAGMTVAEAIISSVGPLISTAEDITTLAILNNNEVVCGYKNGQILRCSLDGHVAILQNEESLHVKNLIKAGMCAFPVAISAVFPYVNGKKVATVLPTTMHNCEKLSQTQLWDVETNTQISSSPCTPVYLMMVLGGFFIYHNRESQDIYITFDPQYASFSELCAFVQNNQFQ